MISQKYAVHETWNVSNRQHPALSRPFASCFALPLRKKNMKINPILLYNDIRYDIHVGIPERREPKTKPNEVIKRAK